MLEYLFNASCVAVGWSGYAVSFLRDFGLAIPSYLSNAPLVTNAKGDWQLTGAIFNIPALFIVFLMTTFLVFGIKESARINNIIVIVKISLVLLFIGFGIAYIKPETGLPSSPNTGEFGHYGWSGVLRERV
jgi:APA family basic amino acid/polyamine antiporter